MRVRGHRWTSTGWIGVGAVALALGGSLGGTLGCTTNAFLCASSDECGAGGQCEASGYCSFPDEACDSMRRYGEHAGNDLAGTCVPVDSASSSTTTTTTTEPAPTPTTTSATLPDPDGGSQGSSTSTGPLVEDTGTTDPPPDMGLPGSTGSEIERVTEGLLALYLFNEQRGEFVYDHAELMPPLDLHIEGSDYQWEDDGLNMQGAIARGVELPDKIVSACQLTNELTLEVWITPAAAVVEGPGRIVTFSDAPPTRNFTLGQGLNEMPAALYVVRLRTDDPSIDANGQPNLNGPKIAAPVLTHVAFSHSADGVDQLYVDGMLVAEDLRPGEFSNWNPDFEFACGNELTLNRPWLGTLHLAAVYDRALSEDEVHQNIDAGF